MLVVAEPLADTCRTVQQMSDDSGDGHGSGGGLQAPEQFVVNRVLAFAGENILLRKSV